MGEALENLRVAVRELKGETARAHPLWGTPQPGETYYRDLSRMLRNGLRTGPKLQSLQGDPQFEELLRQLEPEK